MSEYDDLIEEIQQLTRERDEEAQSADEWQHMYFELLHQHTNLKKQLDKKISELLDLLQNARIEVVG